MTEPVPGPAPTPVPDPASAPKPTFEQRMESFGREAGAAGERFGRDAEAWGQRLAKDPSVQRAGDTAARAWGLLVLAIGAWFFVDVTLGYDMPRIPWGDLWPIGLIVIGLFVIVRGMGRRSA
ncbi:MAG TPA: hypothetical protein VFI34_01565 [Candidatus Limnocylindrales bacterium]|nr:hypothetical protein [Candidatus Limnocylindrales bacterium]